MNNNRIYLDYAAATPMDARVVAAMQPYFTDEFYNPSATYLAALDVTHSLDSARAKVAHWLGAHNSEIIFTAGGTEANNLAVQGVVRQFPGANVVVGATEHESVLAPAGLFDCKIAPVQKDGSVDLTLLADLIDDRTVLVSIMYANNEVGTIQPIREIAQIIKSKRMQRSSITLHANPYPLYFHTDAAQAANFLDLHVSRLGVNMLTLNGGKIYGPKQSGALYVDSQVILQPLILGGRQERNMRSGTENVAAAIGFATALEIAQDCRRMQAEQMQKLQRYFLTLLNDRLPEALLNGSLKKRLPNNVHLTIRGIDNERLLMQLDEAGIMAAAGSACSAGDEEPSHVLRAMGMTDDAARASIRFSMGRSTTKADLAAVVDAMVRFVG